MKYKTPLTAGTALFLLIAPMKDLGGKKNGRSCFGKDKKRKR